MSTIESLPLPGAYVLTGIRTADSRGDFARPVDLSLLAEVAAETEVSYLATAHNVERGTLRGIHYQVPPHQEAKTVWCQSGSVFDVLVDLRSSEPTYGTWISVVLSADALNAVHVPKGVAHGYQTLADDTAVSYLISTPHEPSAARVISWNDEQLAIDWPLAVSAISERDLHAPGWSVHT